MKQFARFLIIAAGLAMIGLLLTLTNAGHSVAQTLLHVLVDNTAANPAKTTLVSNGIVVGNTVKKAPNVTVVVLDKTIDPWGAYNSYEIVGPIDVSNFKVIRVFAVATVGSDYHLQLRIRGSASEFAVLDSDVNPTGSPAAVTKEFDNICAPNIDLIATTPNVANSGILHIIVYGRPD